MRQALELALDWIKKQPEETPHTKYDVDTRYVVLKELEAALAQPEQHTLTSRVNDVRFHKERDEQRAEAMRMLAQPEQEPVAYGTWDTMLGKGHRMMMVRLDKGQDGCTVPLYTTPPQRKPLTDEQMPVGWVFYTSDFSMRAAGKSVKGSVLLVRDEAGRKWWLGLEGNRDSDDFPPLYVGAEGETFEQAIANATDKARAIEAALRSKNT